MATKKRVERAMTVSEAREAGVCRICGKPIRVANAPVGWQREFGKLAYPPPAVTLNFGKEFAHTECLERAIGGKSP